ncbi:MAG: VOC family protein [Actinobacteria bacterium]|nr:VOC family protein [Actinomycetota bacterium]MBV8562374.1 VOC family protein [Actinomycetota bacterium]
MKLAGLHHITMITSDAQRNVDFYADVLGLRLVKKTVNFDDPTAYHLYFGDEQGSPGSILTWFEYQGARQGHAGAGMIHTIGLGVSSPEALDFWAERLAAHGYESSRGEASLHFSDWEGLGLELVVTDDGNAPLRAEHPEIPAEFAIVGIEGARAYAPYANIEETLLTETLGFEHLLAGEYRLNGETRTFYWGYDQATENGRPGAGTVHHIAWTTQDDEQEAWQQRIAEAGGYVSPVMDRDYFRSIYFREPRGVLFEIATKSPGFAVDEDPERLGEQLRVPKMHAHLRDELEQTLTPLVNPRTRAKVEA